MFLMLVLDAGTPKIFPIVWPNQGAPLPTSSANNRHPLLSISSTDLGNVSDPCLWQKNHKTVDDCVDRTRKLGMLAYN